MNKQILLYSTGNYNQYPVTNYNGKEYGGVGAGRRNEHILVNQLRKKKKKKKKKKELLESLRLSTKSL